MAALPDNSSPAHHRIMGPMVTRNSTRIDLHDQAQRPLASLQQAGQLPHKRRETPIKTDGKL